MIEKGRMIDVDIDACIYIYIYIYVDMQIHAWIDRSRSIRITSRYR